MKRILSLILLTTVLLPAAQAQNNLSLRDCIERGLQENYSIRLIRNEQQISDNNLTLGNAGYLPTLDASGGFSGAINDTRTRNAGVTERASGVNSETANVGLNVNWTVFDGFGIQATYERLKELQKIGELNTRMTVEDFIADIASEYYNLIRQKIRLQNLKTSLDLSKERVRIVEAEYHIGTRSGLELKQAQVDFNADSSKILTQTAEVHASRIRLNKLMAAGNVDNHINLKDSLIMPNALLQYDDIKQHVFESNSPLLIAQHNQSVTELDLKKLKSRNYPNIKLNAGYGYTVNWAESAAYDRQNRLGFNYGVTVGFSIFDGFNRRREQNNARLQIESQELRIQDLELSLNADLSNLWMAYNNNLNLWKLESENLIVAQENYQIANDRYRLKELSGIELREAQISLFEAEERKSIAEYSTKICEISLLQLSGQILDYTMIDNNE